VKISEIILLRKAFRVINGCRNKDHLKTAATFLDLAARYLEERNRVFLSERLQEREVEIYRMSGGIV
jgi:cell division protein ZapA (FtsZ GTPase activity inhibitor)